VSDGVGVKHPQGRLTSVTAMEMNTVRI